jgi:hypothetical protein
MCCKQQLASRDIAMCMAAATLVLDCERMSLDKVNDACTSKAQLVFVIKKGPVGAGEQ